MERRRDPYWDNLKLVLIFLVVLGHFLSPVSSNGKFIQATYYWIYLFHMQAFVFVSGYTSKSYVKKKGKEDKLAGFLITFLFFTICIEIVEFIFTHSFRPRILFRITGAPWYMLAMFFWYLLIPFVSRVKKSVSLPIALFVAIFCGLFSQCGNFLTISRTLVFFPAFLCGYFFDGTWVGKFNRQSRILSAVFLIAIFLALFFFKGAMSDFLKIIYAKSSYADLNMSNLTGCMYRLLWYAVSAAMTFSLMSLIPRRQMTFTYLGTRTLSIYIVHRLIRDVFKYLDLYRYLDDEFNMLLLCVLISVAVVLISSSEPVFRFINNVFRFIANLHAKQRRKQLFANP